jgi:hypothetical protein
MVHVCAAGKRYILAEWVAKVSMPGRRGQEWAQWAVGRNNDEYLDLPLPNRSTDQKGYPIPMLKLNWVLYCPGTPVRSRIC